jgi:hypothetical protein
MIDTAALADLLAHNPRRSRRVGTVAGALAPDDPGYLAKQPERDIPNYLSAAGCGVLAEMIRDYWRAKGHEPEVLVKPIEGFKLRYQIRSNLINGLPRESAV